MKNRTSIVIAHPLSTILAADVILVMSGPVVEQGRATATHYAHGNCWLRVAFYARLYQTHISIHFPSCGLTSLSERVPSFNQAELERRVHLKPTLVSRGSGYCHDAIKPAAHSGSPVHNTFERLRQALIAARSWGLPWVMSGISSVQHLNDCT